MSDHPVNAGFAGRALGAPRRFAGERRAQRYGLFSRGENFTFRRRRTASQAGRSIGEPIAKTWTLVSQDLEEALRQASPLLKGFGSWLLSAAAGAGLALLQFVLAILISGAFLANSEAAGRMTQAVARRLAGEPGLEFARVAEQTVRSVASGILGVALIQALLAGLGFLVAGVPAAGLLTLICLLFGVIQLGVVIVLIPVVIYLFSTADTVTAVGFLIWAILVAPVDNILKPLLLGRGVDVPMLIVFVGAIGGFLNDGIIGLFIGAVVLALGYKLFFAWVTEGSPADGLASPKCADRLPDASLKLVGDISDKLPTCLGWLPGGNAWTSRLQTSSLRCGGAADFTALPRPNVCGKHDCLRRRRRGGSLHPVEGVEGPAGLRSSRQVRASGHDPHPRE